VVLQSNRLVVKHKGSEQPLPSPVPANVLGVSLLVDKLLYQLPLYVT
jgi:hypothetical protein